MFASGVCIQYLTINVSKQHSKNLLNSPVGKLITPYILYSDNYRVYLHVFLLRHSAVDDVLDSSLSNSSSVTHSISLQHNIYIALTYKDINRSQSEMCPRKEIKVAVLMVVSLTFQVGSISWYATLPFMFSQTGV